MPMPAPGMPPGANGRVIAISPLFEKIVVGLLSIIITMIGAAYFGLNARINRLEDHFQTTMAADVEIKYLLKNSPHLIQDINEIKNGAKQTHEDVIGLQDSIKSIKLQMQSMQIQLNNIQIQIHTIPGISK